MEVLFGFIYKAFLFLVVIGFVAFIHELGHFLVARLCDVRVDAFAIGMGSQKLWSKTIGETEYSIRIFPIGGFVLLAQEDGWSEDEGRPDPGDRGFQRKNLFQKVAILLAGPFMNVLGTIGILAALWFYFGVPATTLQVVDILKDSPASHSGLQSQDVIVAMNSQQIQKFEEGRLMISQNAGKEMAFQVQRRTDFKGFENIAQLLEYLDDGFEHGNFIRIKNSEGKVERVFDRAELAKRYLGSTSLQGLTIDCSTRIDTLNLKITPDSEGKVGIHIQPYRIGDLLITLPFMQSLSRAVDSTLYMTKAFFIQISRILIHLVQKFQAPKEIGGPVAIAYAISQGADQGAYSFLWLSAQICLSIGVFNLIPIPGLDGGRIFVILLKDTINGVARNIFGSTKDAFNEVVEGYINIFGVLCVLSLILLVTYKDIQDLMSG